MSERRVPRPRRRTATAPLVAVSLVAIGVAACRPTEGTSATTAAAAGAARRIPGPPPPLPTEPPPIDPRATLVDIPAGQFVAGDPHGPTDEAPRAVTVAAFRLMRTEVTNAEFAAFVAATGHVTDPERAGRGHVWWRFDDAPGYTWRVLAGASWRIPHGAAGPALTATDDAHAVVQVSANDAEAFCAHFGLRLPDADEWEWAARGPDGRRYVWGDTPPAKAPVWRLGNLGSFDCCRPDATDGAERVGVVGRYPEGASPFGVLDLLGNVWEWTRTPSARTPGKRVIRGGGWGNSASAWRVAIRHENPPDRGLDMVGFRCAGPPAPVATAPSTPTPSN
jgi:formylglycine-generating enzyme required for sulfatase activity